MKVRARLVTLAGVAAASLLLTAVPASADSGKSITYMRDFVGTWVNPDTDAYSTVKIWRDDRGRARVKIWGACVPTECLIGTFTAEKFHFDTTGTGTAALQVVQTSVTSSATNTSNPELDTPEPWERTAYLFTLESGMLVLQSTETFLRDDDDRKPYYQQEFLQRK